MNLKDITTAMSAWEGIRNNAEALNGYFAGGNGFTVPTDFEITGDYVHAYPGIVDNRLVYFLINAEHDIKDQVDIQNYVTQCDIAEITIDLTPAVDNLSGTEIEPEEAKTRIRNWRDNRINWVNSHAVITDGIYQAFLVPMGDYVANNTHSTFLALAGASGNFSADLITRDERTGRIMLTSFHDMVRPVPPFGGTGTPSSQGSFYLLSLA